MHWGCHDAFSWARAGDRRGDAKEARFPLRTVGMGPRLAAMAAYGKPLPVLTQTREPKPKLSPEERKELEAKAAGGQISTPKPPPGTAQPSTKDNDPLGLRK
jgi:hypothetical protein